LQRNAELAWLKSPVAEGECRILTNARCLSEGVDVPALDAVLFLHPRKSIVDVVQSVGRVMRLSPGKEYGYVILPVAVPSGIDPADALADNVRLAVSLVYLSVGRDMIDALRCVHRPGPHRRGVHFFAAFALALRAATPFADISSWRGLAQVFHGASTVGGFHRPIGVNQLLIARVLRRAGGRGPFGPVRGEGPTSVGACLRLGTAFEWHYRALLGSQASAYDPEA
jgi:hypothetical protein